MFGREKGIHTPEFRNKKRKERRIRLAIIAALAILLVGLPIYLLRHQALLVNEIQVKGNVVTKAEDVARLVKSKLDGNYLLIIPKRSVLFYPHDAIVRTLEEEIPRLKDVDVSLLDNNAVMVSLAERQPFALYCQDIRDLSTPEDCYFLDDKGLIFSQAPAFSGDVYFIYHLPIPLAEPVGSQLIDEETFSNLPEFVESLEDIGVHGRVLVFSSEDYRLILPNGGEIIWKKSDDQSLVRDNLAAFLSDAVVKDGDFLNKIRYIDMRFSNKVFYKFQE